MISEQDIEDVKALGYIVDVASPLAAQLLNSHFPGLDLAMLLAGIEELLDTHTKKPSHKRIVIDATPVPYFQILYLSDNYADKDTGLTMSRYFEYENGLLIVYHHYLVLPKSARGQGLGTRIMGLWFDQYVNMGVKEIRVHAGLKDGGAVWAKVGFKASEKYEMEDILQSARTMLAGSAALQDVEAIFNNYYQKEPEGKAFPIEDWANIDEMLPVLKLETNNWHGRIDLTNQEELLNFKEYVGRQ
jgi:GNAT superfamily N-acetyltransferase